MPIAMPIPIPTLTLPIATPNPAPTATPTAIHQPFEAVRFTALAPFGWPAMDRRRDQLRRTAAAARSAQQRPQQRPQALAVRPHPP
ncbi:hypothetical protein GCM10027570_01580 [Streptomonospora sediminis]